jgi:two-component system, OmpR family, phosphate regulon sensor histidine kinase PhoR
VRARLFGKLGLTYLVLLLALLLAVNWYASPAFRGRLFVLSFVILILGVAASLFFSRVYSSRVERLKDFSRQVAEGNFRPLPSEPQNDELTELAQALNETVKHLEGSIRSLTDERNRSSAILRSMVEGVAVMDTKERIVFCNQAFAEILNQDAQVCEGRTLLEIVRQMDLVSAIRRALQSGEIVQGEVAVGTVQPRSFAVTAAPVDTIEAPQAGGRAEARKGAVVVLHDITELRRLERIRQDFVANVSHEFKTPLTAIQGFAETLLGGALNDVKNNRRFLEIIRDHAVRLARLTDDLLRLARIEAGKLELDFQPVPLAELLESCAATSLLKARQKQLSLQIACPPGLPSVLGDASLLREVLQNLLDNAVQYTPPGGRIQVSAAVHDGEAILTVADTGVGIPLAEQERIFERFYRVDAARSREVGGTGLGLSISKHIVEAHGGRIWVESDIGRGSQFHFSIPLVP